MITLTVVSSIIAVRTCPIKHCAPIDIVLVVVNILVFTGPIVFVTLLVEYLGYCRTDRQIHYFTVCGVRCVNRIELISQLESYWTLSSSIVI